MSETLTAKQSLEKELAQIRYVRMSIDNTPTTIPWKCMNSMEKLKIAQGIIYDLGLPAEDSERIIQILDNMQFDENVKKEYRVNKVWECIIDRYSEILHIPKPRSVFDVDQYKRMIYLSKFIEDTLDKKSAEMFFQYYLENYFCD